MQENIPLKNGKMLCIREAEPDDAEAMLALAKVVGSETDFLLTDANGWSYTVESEREMLAAWMADPDRCMFLAFTDEGLAGFFSVTPVGHRPRNRHNASMGIAIRKSCWHLGIGAMAMVISIDFARERGYHKLSLDVHADNGRAIALYKRFGFVECGRKRDELFIDGDYFDEILMERML